MVIQFLYVKIMFCFQHNKLDIWHLIAWLSGVLTNIKNVVTYV